MLLLMIKCTLLENLFGASWRTARKLGLVDARATAAVCTANDARIICPEGRLSSRSLARLPTIGAIGVLGAIICRSAYWRWATWPAHHLAAYWIEGIEHVIEAINI
jgi:hypothetical protein